MCISFQVKHIDQGINPSSVHKIFFTGDYVLKGFKIGVVAAMVALTVCLLKWLLIQMNLCNVVSTNSKYLQEAIAIGRTFAAMKDYHIDGNKEMIALGSMNIAGSLTSCYVATGTSLVHAVNSLAFADAEN